MSKAVEAQDAQPMNASTDDMQPTSTPSPNSSAVSDAQLRAAKKVIDAYVNKTQTRGRPATISRSTSGSAAHSLQESRGSQGN